MYEHKESEKRWVNVLFAYVLIYVALNSNTGLILSSVISVKSEFMQDFCHPPDPSAFLPEWASEWYRQM